MILNTLALCAVLAAQTPAPQAPATQTPASQAPSAAQAALPFVVSVLHEASGQDDVLRFVLSGPPTSYSATPEDGGIIVRIAASPLSGLTLPAPRAPFDAMLLGEGPTFTLRVRLAENRRHEMVRDSSSLRLILKAPVQAAAPAAPAATPQPEATPNPNASPSPAPVANRDAAVASDTGDLYRRLFPTTGDPTNADLAKDEIASKDNWFSNFKWLGIQARPWVSVSYVDGKTVQPQTHTVTEDAYWVIQPNLGLGFSPRIGGRDEGEGQWKINYTPRFRRLANLGLPHLTSHFFDLGVDQPVAALGSVYATYHLSRGVLETEEVDAGREYGIGLNRVIDTPLERFRRSSIDLGIRVNFVADTELNIGASQSKVRYGDTTTASSVSSGDRAFFDYDSRMLNASLRRGLGESRFLSALFSVHDTPAQTERVQAEGRGYSYGVSLEGDLVALTTGRLMFGYRTQENPNAGLGGQSYKNISYGAQLVRDISDDTTLGLNADRRLYLSAYADNGFYVADSLKADLNTRLLLGVYLRASGGLQSNHYKASPQSNDGSTLVLRQDRIRNWSVGLARSLREWLFLRADYVSERRDSNLDRFDIRTRAFTVQLGVGFFGTPGGRTQATW